MSKLRKRDRHLLELGFKNLKGKIKTNKSFENGIPISSISINLKNIFIEDIPFIISELETRKEFLGNEFEKTLIHLNLLKT